MKRVIIASLQHLNYQRILGSKMSRDYFMEHAVGDVQRFSTVVKRDILGLNGGDKANPDSCNFVNDFIAENVDCQYVGTLYRGTGMTEEEFSAVYTGARLKPGRAVGQYLEAPSSWSSIEEVAARFSRSSRDDAIYEVIFVEDSPGRKTAIPISGIVENDNMSQIIYSGRPWFKVKSIEDKAFTYPNGVRKMKTYVYVEEL